MWRRTATVLGSGAQRSVAPSPTVATTADVLGSDLGEEIARISRSAAYLRQHAPTELYVSCDHQANWRHSTVLLDATAPGEMPMSHATFFLASSPLNKTQPDASYAALVGLPWYSDEVALDRFFGGAADHAAHVQPTATSDSSEWIHTVVLQDLNPYAAAGLRRVRVMCPSVRVACCPFVASFLTNPQTFSVVREAIVHHSVLFRRKEDLQFAELPEDVLSVIDDGSQVVFSNSGRPTSATRPPGRMDLASPGASSLRTLHVTSATVPSCPAYVASNLPRALRYSPLMLYDSAFGAVFTGRAAGVHIPWLSSVLPGVSPSTLLPAPPALSAMSNVPGQVVKPWDIARDVQFAVWALRRFPHVQHVITSAFGESPAGVEEHIESLQESAEKLIQLRDRFAAFTTKSTASAQGLAKSQLELKWKAKLEEKVRDEILRSGTPTGASDKAEATGNETRERSHATQVESVLRRGFIGDVSAAVMQSALRLPTVSPKEVPGQPKGSAHDGRHAKEPYTPRPPKEVPATSRKPSVEEERALLKELFASRGLGQLKEVLDREEIDPEVFLSMTSEDLKSVFSATFGVVKRMEILQQDMRRVKQESSGGRST